MGHQAVIVFFVLSGFLVGGGAIRALKNRRWSTKLYLLQRATRLWVVLIPALLLVALLDTIGSRFFSSSIRIYATLRSPVLTSVWNVIPIHFSASTFAGNLFFLQGILVPYFGSDCPLWSLSYEFWYYIMFPVLLVVILPSSKMPRRIFSVVALIAMLIFCGRQISIYFLIWMMGAVTSCMPNGILQATARRLAPWMCLFYAFFNLYVVVRPFNLLASDFITGLLFSVVLWLLLHLREPVGESLYRNVSTKLSAMSYTLYCVHYPIILLLSAWLAPRLSQQNRMQSAALLLIVYAAAFITAYLFYRCFEANTGCIRRFFAARLGFQSVG